MSPYPIVLRKFDTCSCKKAAWKSPKTVEKDSGCESRGLHCVYRQKDNPYINWKLVKSCILETCIMMSIATPPCISLTCLWVRTHIIFITYSLDIMPPSILHKFAAKVYLAHSPNHRRTLQLRRTRGRLEITYLEYSYLPASDTPTKRLVTQRQARN